MKKDCFSYIAKQRYSMLSYIQLSIIALLDSITT